MPQWTILGVPRTIVWLYKCLVSATQRGEICAICYIRPVFGFTSLQFSGALVINLDSHFTLIFYDKNNNYIITDYEKVVIIYNSESLGEKGCYKYGWLVNISTANLAQHSASVSRWEHTFDYMGLNRLINLLIHSELFKSHPFISWKWRLFFQA